MSPSASSLPAKALLALIQLYKWTLSPFVGRDCRYLPTCSSYAADAVRAHGAWAGSWMAFARLCRCHPFGGRGYDPAPDVTNGKWWAPWTYGDWRGGVREANDDAATLPARGGSEDAQRPEGWGESQRSATGVVSPTSTGWDSPHPVRFAADPPLAGRVAPAPKWLD